MKKRRNTAPGFAALDPSFLFIIIKGEGGICGDSSHAIPAILFLVLLPYFLKKKGKIFWLSQWLPQFFIQKRRLDQRLRHLPPFSASAIHLSHQFFLAFLFELDSFETMLFFSKNFLLITNPDFVFFSSNSCLSRYILNLVLLLYFWSYWNKFFLVDQ